MILHGNEVARVSLSCLQLIICSLFIFGLMLLFHSSRKNIERFLCQIQMVKPVRMYFFEPTGFLRKVQC